MIAYLLVPVLDISTWAVIQTLYEGKGWDNVKYIALGGAVMKLLGVSIYSVAGINTYYAPIGVL